MRPPTWPPIEMFPQAVEGEAEGEVDEDQRHRLAGEAAGDLPLEDQHRRRGSPKIAPDAPTTGVVGDRRSAPADPASPETR